MKKLGIFLGLAMVMLLATTAVAGEVFKKTLYNNYTGLDSTARYTTPFNYGVYTKKTVIVGGQHANGAFAPYTGTFTLQGSSSATGPWTTVKDKAGNAVTATGNAVFDIDSALPFLRAVWTRTKHRITSFIYYSE